MLHNSRFFADLAKSAPSGRNRPVHPGLPAALAEDRRKCCPCGAAAEPRWGLCRKCIARITWRRRTRRPHWRAIRRHVGRQAPRQDGDLRPADLVDTPKGKKNGRPSKASLMTGIRTEEASALHWSHVVAWVPKAKEWWPVTEVGFRHKKYAAYVWRSVRQDGDTKTELSRRTLEIPDEVAKALEERHAQQARQRLQAGKAWGDNDLVCSTDAGTSLDAANVRCSFRRITQAAGLGAN